MLYSTVVADPPWHYDDFVYGKTAGWRKRIANGGALCDDDLNRKELPFPTMSVEEIAALPVSELADVDAALFLWTTNKWLPDAFAVVTAWGFAYRQLIVWQKTNYAPFGGSIAPNSAEYLLVCVRGAHRWHGRARASVVTSKRDRHSQKPEVFLDLIEQVSPGPYLELFARRNRLGWDTWGNQALEHVEMEAVRGL